MLHTKIKPVAMAIIVATSLSSTMTTYAQADNTPNIMEKMTIERGKTASPQDEKMISSAATKTLRHIAQARSDIHGNDLTAARDELDKANRLLDIIQASMPTTEIRDRIWIAKKHLEYEDTQEVVSDLIPIYSSLDELVDYMPVQSAKTHLDNAKQQMKQGNKEPATEELDATNAALLYTEADLPLAATRRLVASANVELEKGNGDAANAALKSAEENVVFLSIGVDEPLVSAKSSLWQASRDYAAGAYDNAKSEIHQAITNLESAAKSTDATVSNEASQLLKTAKALGDKIDNGDHSLGGEVEQLWQRTAALSERAVDYVGSGWSQLRTDNSVKSNLIEAKLYLNYARIDQFTAKDNNRSNTDINQALQYLIKAAADVENNKATTPAIKNKIDTINTSATALAKLSIAQRTESQLTHLSTEISQVIQQL